MGKPDKDFISELFLSKDVANAIIAATICEGYVDNNPEDIEFKNFYLNKLSYWNRVQRGVIYGIDTTGMGLPEKIKSKYLKGKRRWR